MKWAVVMGELEKQDKPKTPAPKRTRYRVMAWLLALLLYGAFFGGIYWMWFSDDSSAEDVPADEEAPSKYEELIEVIRDILHPEESDAR